MANHIRSHTEITLIWKHIWFAEKGFQLLQMRTVLNVITALPLKPVLPDLLFYNSLVWYTIEDRTDCYSQEMKSDSITCLMFLIDISIME